MTAPTTRAELVEWLSRQLFNPLDSLRWNDVSDVIHRYWRGRAEEILAALDTFAVVCPREPTEAMARALYASANPYVEWEDLGEDEFNGVHLDAQAAIAASPFAPERGGGNEQAG